MKKQILILAGLAIAVLQFWGCGKDGGIFGNIRGSGNIIPVNFNYSDFERVDVSDAFELTLIESDTFFVQVTIDDNLAKYVQVTDNNGWLNIGMASGHGYNTDHQKAEVHMPFITDLNGSGATAIDMQPFADTVDFNLDLSGASVYSGSFAANICNIRLSGASVMNVSMNCTELYMDVSGASVVNMYGSCTDFYLDGSGASVFTLGNFITNNSVIELSGASDATIHVLDHLDAKLSGASVLKYYGDPVMGNISITGASVIMKL
jgi:hypothetical protein